MVIVKLPLIVGGKKYKRPESLFKLILSRGAEEVVFSRKGVFEDYDSLLVMWPGAPVYYPLEQTDAGTRVARLADDLQ